MLFALRTVFVHVWSLAVTLAIFLVSTTLMLLWSNTSLLGIVWTNQSTSIGYKLQFLALMLTSTPDALGWLAVFVILITSLLLGIVVSMSLYTLLYIHNPQALRKSAVSTSGGLIATVFGVGCAACGSMMIASILTAVGAAGLLLLLPFHGTEFGFLAIALLLYSVYGLARVISGPRVC